MDSLNASNFRRVNAGMLLDLVLLFLVPAILAVLLVLVVNQLSAAVGQVEALTAADILALPIPAIKATYIVLAMHYCLDALCALLVVSGLGELENVSREFGIAKRWFMILIVTDCFAMIGHFLSVFLKEGTEGSITSVLYLVAVLLLLVFRSLALRTLLRGCSEVMESIGESKRSRKALTLSAHIIVATALLAGIVAAAFILSVCNLLDSVRVFLLVLAMASAVFYFVCRIRTIRCSRALTRLIENLSD